MTVKVRQSSILIIQMYGLPLASTLVILVSFIFTIMITSQNFWRVESRAQNF